MKLMKNYDILLNSEHNATLDQYNQYTLS